ncbi:MAG: hypothetical protein DWQ08_09715 [Proteobacteria bacterium]|nr:MAG: hypothetical protein DWQ08_09715 [Pseudomonadota bacterium]
MPTNPTSTTARPDGRCNNEVRLDRWLWAARFYKTRQLSVTALKSGKVALNGRKAKPSRAVRVGDKLTVRREQFLYDVEVLELREKRVGAELAQKMYRETEESLARRRELEAQRDAQRKTMRYPDGRPSKKDRRILGQFKRGDFTQ